MDMNSTHLIAATATTKLRIKAQEKVREMIKTRQIRQSADCFSGGSAEVFS